MFKIVASPIVEEWDTLVAQPTEELLLASNIRSSGTVRDLLNAENKIWLGKPTVFNLQELALGSPDSEFVKQILEDFDLALVQFSCSFRAASTCEFIEASLQVSMENLPTSDEELPIAYDLFPEEVFMPVSYKRTFSISPKLKMEFVKVLQVEVSAFESENAQEHVIYRPEITAFGKGTSTVRWDFNKSSSRELKGIRDLFLVIKKAKSSSIRLNLQVLDCKVRTSSIGVLPLPNIFSRTTKESVISDNVLILSI